MGLSLLRAIVIVLCSASSINLGSRPVAFISFGLRSESETAKGAGNAVDLGCRFGFFSLAVKIALAPHNLFHLDHEVLLGANNPVHGDEAGDCGTDKGV